MGFPFQPLEPVHFLYNSLTGKPLLAMVHACRVAQACHWCGDEGFGWAHHQPCIHTRAAQFGDVRAKPKLAHQKLTNVRPCAQTTTNKGWRPVVNRLTSRQASVSSGSGSGNGNGPQINVLRLMKRIDSPL